MGKRQPMGSLRLRARRNPQYYHHASDRRNQSHSLPERATRARAPAPARHAAGGRSSRCPPEPPAKEAGAERVRVRPSSPVSKEGSSRRGTRRAGAPAPMCAAVCADGVCASAQESAVCVVAVRRPSSVVRASSIIVVASRSSAFFPPRGNPTVVDLATAWGHGVSSGEQAIPRSMFLDIRFGVRG